MSPAELAVYDHYGAWIAHVVDVCQAAQALPLDALLAANVRIRLTGALIGPGETEPATPEQMDRHRRLIEAVVAFRDSLPVDPAPAH